MVYVMSDIHGEYDRYQKMLELIGFSGEDQLYIIGDVIDRYSGGIEILRDVMARPNVTMLLGNHEQMCLDVMYAKKHEADALKLWRFNKGEVTRKAMLALDEAERNEILRYLAALPDHLDLDVGGRKFHLVHGFPGVNRHNKLWGRPDYDTLNPFPDDRTLIIGHTPVDFLVHSGAEEQDGRPMAILHAPGFIDIDCGCGHRSSTRRLACLRLDDMAEFYV